jgi:hypothetical protein
MQLTKKKTTATLAAQVAAAQQAAREAQAAATELERQEIYERQRAAQEVARQQQAAAEQRRIRQVADSVVRDLLVQLERVAGALDLVDDDQRTRVATVVNRILTATKPTAASATAGDDVEHAAVVLEEIRPRRVRRKTEAVPPASTPVTGGWG